MLNKILSIFLALSFCFVFAAENESNNLIRQFSGYTPLPPHLRLVDPEVEKKDYEIVKKIISNVEAEYMRHLGNLLAKEKDQIDTAIKYRVSSQFLFSNSGNYYETVSSVARKRDFMNQAFSEILRAEERFLPIRKTLPLAGVNENEVKTTEFKMLRMRGILSLLRGGVDDLRNATASFETILTNAREALSQDDVAEVYTYLIGTLDQLYQYYASSSPALGISYIRKQLYYVWKLALLKNGSNEKLRDVKLMDLVKIYYTIIDYEGQDFKDLYKPYVDKLGLSYTSVEKAPAKSSTNQ